MKTSYRLVHFVPDPLLEARFTLGAIITDGRVVRAVKAARLPGPECLGRRKAHIVARMLQAELDSIRSPTELPPSFGPYASLGEAHEIPAGVVDAAAWVERVVLDGHRDQQPRGATRAPRLSRYGDGFFRTWHLGHVVKARYEPGRDWGGWLGGHAAFLRPVTHWVASDEQILLMEPLVPGRARREHDVKDVGEKFAAYRWAMERGEGTRRGLLYAFLVSDGDQEARRQIVNRLGDVADVVIDTEEADSRQRFVELVRTLGSASTDLH